MTQAEKRHVEDWLPFMAFCERFSHLYSVGGFRWLRLHDKKFNSSHFFKLCGKKLMGSPSLFMEWINNDKLRREKNDA